MIGKTGPKRVRFGTAFVISPQAWKWDTHWVVSHCLLNPILMALSWCSWPEYSLFREALE
jgi:hypothetical protein